MRLGTVVEVWTSTEVRELEEMSRVLREGTLCLERGAKRRVGGGWRVVAA